MRIAFIGSNGQVASEVILLLSTQADVELMPLVRSRGGSAFLRYEGVPVIHCQITDRARAVSVLNSADVIANFALAGGTPSVALKRNEEIIRATFDYSPSFATVVFFSTLAVHGAIEQGRSRKSAYSNLKLNNERLVVSLARALGRKAYSLRLGHVAGVYQKSTHLCREEILNPPVVMPDPDRHSNVTHTVTIADALLAIGSGRAGPPGRYDLVNVPQWTWREVYEREADELGVELKLETLDTQPAQRLRPGVRTMEIVFGTIRRLGLRERLTRIAAGLPGSVNDVMIAEHYVNRVRSEIAALHRPPALRNPAAFWPALEIHSLEGLQFTRDLFSSSAFPMEHRRITRWPADLTEQSSLEACTAETANAP